MAEQGEFRANARGAPGRVLAGHATDPGNDDTVDTRPTAAATRPPAPEQFEPAAMPADHGLGFDDRQGRGPLGPRLDQPGPEQAVAHGQPRPCVEPAQGGELLAQGKVLQDQVRAADEDQADQPAETPDQEHDRFPG